MINWKVFNFFDILVTVEGDTVDSVPPPPPNDILVDDQAIDNGNPTGPSISNGLVDFLYKAITRYKYVSSLYPFIPFHITFFLFDIFTLLFQFYLKIKIYFHLKISETAIFPP